MTDYDVKAIANAAWEVLYCMNRDFLLAIPYEGKLCVFRSNCKNENADSVSCRLDKFYRNQLEISFDDKPQPKLPENVAILSGTCRSVNEIAAYFNLELDNGGRCNVCYCDSAAEHFKKELKVGDRLKIRIYFDFSGLTIREVDDILSHTRTETSTITIDLKE